MAIQHRRGTYSTFNKNKLLAGEMAFVTSGDPSNTLGTAVYACFGNGDVQRLATAEEVHHDIDNFVESKGDEIKEEIKTESTTAINTAITNAQNATSSASTAATAANAAKEACDTATAAADSAVTRANAAAANAEQYVLGDISDKSVNMSTTEETEITSGMAMADIIKILSKAIRSVSASDDGTITLSRFDGTTDTINVYGKLR